MDFIFQRTYRGPLKAVVLDWAGTAVDYGSFAPTAVFLRLFASRGVPITIEDARSGMGLMKKEHLRTILARRAVSEAWAVAHGAAPTEAKIRTRAESQLYQAGAHYVVDGIRDLPAVLDKIQARLAQGEQP